MSKIEFTFSTLPHYFRQHGWLDPKPDGSHMKMITLLWWIFDRCSSEPRRVFHDHKQVDLDPYEFIFGRVKCSEQTGLTEKEIRGRLDWMVEAKILEKTASKTANKFTVYRWLTESFSENKGQQKGEQRASRGPAEGHNKEEEEDKKKKKSEVAVAPASTQIFYRELVNLKLEEFESLKSKFAAEQLDWMLDKLNFYLSTTTKKRAKGASCYAYFKKGSWLLTAYEEHKSKATRPSFASAGPIIPFLPELSDDRVDPALAARLREIDKQQQHL